MVGPPAVSTTFLWTIDAPVIIDETICLIADVGYSGSYFPAA